MHPEIVSTHLHRHLHEGALSTLNHPVFRILTGRYRVGSYCQSANLLLVNIDTLRRITVRMMMKLWTITDADLEHISWVFHAAFACFSCPDTCFEVKDVDVGKGRDKKSFKVFKAAIN